MILGIGTSCPPSITRLAIRAALMAGELVKTFLLSKALLSQILTIFHRLQNSFPTVPVTELFLSDNIWIDIDCVFKPFMVKYF